MLKSSEVNGFFSRYENQFDVKLGLLKVFKPQEKFNWKEIERNFEILLEAQLDQLEENS